jgi:hypothetical protein
MPATPPARRTRVRAAVAAAIVLVGAIPARRTAAAPAQMIPPDDAIRAELRVLDLRAPAARGVRWRLPHLDAWPLQVRELSPAAGDSAGAVPAQGPDAIAARRVARALARDGVEGPGASTPRLLQRAWPDDQRLEVSAGLEGANDWADLRRPRSRWRDGSGLHVRTGVQVDRWFAFSHLWFGELRGVGAFGDALVARTDVAASTDESGLVYSGRGWSAQLGRSRWQWGPGEEASLLLSGTSAPLNSLMLHARLDAVRADAFFLSATVEPGTGEQLAAHRLEWQPFEGVRVGASEAARYHAGGWQGVYLAGVIPYAVAQRLLDQEHHDPAGVLRNNVMVAFDASVRVADGSRVYGELLLDDLHARSAAFPNKYGAQAGLSGTGEALGTRLTWNAEYTWLSRFVYTSSFGRAYVAQGEPLGFPTGPGSRRFRTRVSCDPGVDWQLSAFASETERGAEGLADAYVPGTPVPDVTRLAGVVERERALEGELRWWPAGGVDLALRAGRVWVENAGHAAGVDAARWRGTLAFRLVR